MAMDTQSVQALDPLIMYKPCRSRLGVPNLRLLPPLVLFLPRRWSQITLRPTSRTLVSSTMNKHDMPKSERTGRPPDYRSVGSWKETESVDHEVQLMNGGGRSMSHNEKSGAAGQSLCLDRRRRGLQSDEMYLADDIDTKLRKFRNHKKCPSQLTQRRLELTSPDQLPKQRHRSHDSLPDQLLPRPDKATRIGDIRGWLRISPVRMRIPIHSTSEPTIALNLGRFTAQFSRQPIQLLDRIHYDPGRRPDFQDRQMPSTATSMAGCRLTLMLNHDHHPIPRQLRPMRRLRPDDSQSRLEISVLAVHLCYVPRRCSHRYQASRLLLLVVMRDLREIVISHHAGSGRHISRHRPKIHQFDVTDEVQTEPTNPTLTTVSALVEHLGLAIKDGERLGQMLRLQPRSKS